MFQSSIFILFAPVNQFIQFIHIINLIIMLYMLSEWLRFEFRYILGRLKSIENGKMKKLKYKNVFFYFKTPKIRRNLCEFGLFYTIVNFEIKKSPAKPILSIHSLIFLHAVCSIKNCLQQTWNKYSCSLEIFFTFLHSRMIFWFFYSSFHFRSKIGIGFEIWIQ